HRAGERTLRQGRGGSALPFRLLLLLLLATPEHELLQGPVPRLSQLQGNPPRAQGHRVS
ncbi:unnamed protein product, partial [Ixodes pacificus]